MNRTVYYHKAVKVFEFMMEEFLRRVVLGRDELEGAPALAGAVPPYLGAVARLIGASEAPTLERFVTAHMNAYIRMAEPAIWHLVAAIADSPEPVSVRVRELARSLVSRRPLPAWRVAAGAEAALGETLAAAGFAPDEDFAVVDLRTTVYREADERVYVGRDDGRVDDIIERSEILSLLRNREEKESVLIVLDRAKMAGVEEATARSGALEPE